MRTKSRHITARCCPESLYSLALSGSASLKRGIRISRLILCPEFAKIMNRPHSLGLFYFSLNSNCTACNEIESGYKKGMPEF